LSVVASRILYISCCKVITVFFERHACEEISFGKKQVVITKQNFRIRDTISPPLFKNLVETSVATYLLRIMI
jgi:hypothetical protein